MAALLTDQTIQLICLSHLAAKPLDETVQLSGFVGVLFSFVAWKKLIARLRLGRHQS